jgi:hypothetical protein
MAGRNRPRPQLFLDRPDPNVKPGKVRSQAAIRPMRTRLLIFRDNRNNDAFFRGNDAFPD